MSTIAELKRRVDTLTPSAGAAPVPYCYLSDEEQGIVLEMLDRGYDYRAIGDYLAMRPGLAGNPVEVDQ